MMLSRLTVNVASKFRGLCADEIQDYQSHEVHGESLYWSKIVKNTDNIEQH